jgi:hypothetical protein
MKVAINVCEGGFSLSDWAFEKLIDLGWQVTDNPNEESDLLACHCPTREYCLSPKWETKKKELRTHPDIITVIEELQHDAETEFSKLKVIEIPDDINWVIEDCDGNEWVSEEHKTWK